MYYTPPPKNACFHMPSLVNATALRIDVNPLQTFPKGRTKDTTQFTQAWDKWRQRCLYHRLRSVISNSIRNKQFFLLFLVNNKVVLNKNNYFRVGKNMVYICVGLYSIPMTKGKSKTYGYKMMKALMPSEPSAEKTYFWLCNPLISSYVIDLMSSLDLRVLPTVSVLEGLVPWRTSLACSLTKASS